MIISDHLPQGFPHRSIPLHDPRLGAAGEVQQLQLRRAADDALQRLVGEELATAEAKLLGRVSRYAPRNGCLVGFMVISWIF